MLLLKARTLLDLPKASERNVRVLEMDSAAAKIACSPGTFYAAKSPNIAGANTLSILSLAVQLLNPAVVQGWVCAI